MPPELRRDHCVSVRLNSDELRWLDDSRSLVGMQRGEYLRAAAVNRLPPTIPPINREAWAALARVGANLNQYQTAINEGRASVHNPEVLDELRRILADVRLDLIGVNVIGGESEGEG